MNLTKRQKDALNEQLTGIAHLAAQNNSIGFAEWNENADGIKWKDTETADFENLEVLESGTASDGEHLQDYDVTFKAIFKDRKEPFHGYFLFSVYVPKIVLK